VKTSSSEVGRAVEHADAVAAAHPLPAQLGVGGRGALDATTGVAQRTTSSRVVAGRSAR
jgi:hypothetical protein